MACKRHSILGVGTPFHSGLREILDPHPPPAPPAMEQFWGKITPLPPTVLELIPKDPTEVFVRRLETRWSRLPPPPSPHGRVK